MGEEARTTDHRRLAGGVGDRDCNGIVPVDDGYKDRVIEWEHGLPDCGDLTPLCQALVPSGLAWAFSIKPEPSRTTGDVTLASRSTLSNLRGGTGTGASSQAFSTLNNHYFRALDGGEYGRDEEEEEEEEEEKEDVEAEDMIVDCSDDDGGGKKQLRKNDSAEEADSATDGSKASKRPRLVWTPPLHKRFVDVVSHLGIKNAVPKTIMQLMNVEGLTRENVASHLQKYRLYQKRKQGGGGGSMIGNSDGGGSSGMGMAALSATDQLFASKPAPPHGMNIENGNGGGVRRSGGHAHGHAHRHNGTYGSYGNGDMGNGHIPMPMMMGYGVPGGMVGMPVYGMYGGGHPGMAMDGNHHHHQYGPMVPHPPQSGASSDNAQEKDASNERRAKLWGTYRP